jgi:hypothetical protein
MRFWGENLLRRDATEPPQRHPPKSRNRFSHSSAHGQTLGAEVRMSQRFPEWELEPSVTVMTVQGCPKELATYRACDQLFWHCNLFLPLLKAPSRQSRERAIARELIETVLRPQDLAALSVAFLA